MSNTLAVARARLTGRGAVGSVCFDLPVLPCVQIGQGHCCLFYIQMFISIAYTCISCHTTVSLNLQYKYLDEIFLPLQIISTSPNFLQQVNCCVGFTRRCGLISPDGLLRTSLLFPGEVSLSVARTR